MKTGKPPSRGRSFHPGPLAGGKGGPSPSRATAASASPDDSPPAALLALGRPLSPSPGSPLFDKGDPADRCYFVRSGEVVVCAPGKDGTETELARVRSGEWFGEAILFAAPAFPVGARSGESGAAILSFGREELLAHLAVSPESAAYFLSLLARKCLALNRRLDELTLMPVRQRLARYLTSLCDRMTCGNTSTGSCTIDLPAKKRQIASELGMAPETFSRNVKALESDGIIRLSLRSVTILDCRRLRREAQG